MRNLKLFILLWVCIPVLAVAQTSYVWNGSTSGDWNTSTNWTPIGIPGAADHVSIPLTVNTLVLTANQSVTNFTITSGTLNLGGFTLQASGNTTFTAGTIQNGTFQHSGLASSVAIFTGTNFASNVVLNVVAERVILNGGVISGRTYMNQTGTTVDALGNGFVVFNGKTTLENSGTRNFWIRGGCQYNDSTTFITSNTGSMLPELSQGSTYNAPLTLTTTSTGQIRMAYNGTTQINDDLIFNGTGSANIQFGEAGTASILLGANTDLLVGNLGFNNSRIYFNRTSQTSAKDLALTLPASCILLFDNNCLFYGKVNFNSGRIFAARTIFNDEAVFTKTGPSTDNSAGGNTFNKDVYFYLQGTGNLAFGTTLNEIFQGDIYVSNTSLYELTIGRTVLGSFQLAAGKTIKEGPGGFQSGRLSIRGLDWSAGIPFELDFNYAAANVALNTCRFGDAVKIRAGGITTTLVNYNAPVTFNKMGTENSYSVGRNVFGATLHLENNGTGHFVMGNTMVDTLYDDVRFLSTSTMYTSLGWGTTGGAYFYPGVEIITDASMFQTGMLYFNGLEQTDATAQTVRVNTAAGVYFNRCTIKGDLTAEGGRMLTRDSKFEQNVRMRKTGAVSDQSWGNQFNIIGGNSEFENTGTDYLMFGGSTADVFNKKVTARNLGNSHIYLAYNGTNNIFADSLVLINQSAVVSGIISVGGNAAINTLLQGDIVVEAISGNGIYFGTGATSNLTLSAGKTIKIGSGGFNSGPLHLARFTKLGPEPTNLSLANVCQAVIGPNSSMNGDMTIVAGGVNPVSTTFFGVVDFTKTGNVFDLSTGGNVYEQTFTYAHNGFNATIMANNGPGDWYKADATFNNNGNGIIYVAHNCAGNTFDGDVTVNVAPVGGTNAGVRFCEATNGQATFNGVVNAKNGGTHTSSYIRFGQGASSITTFNGPVTAINDGPATSNFVIDFGQLGVLNFNQPIVVANNTNGGIMFSQSGGSSTLATGQTISIDPTIGYPTGYLNLRRFIQTGATAHSLMMGTLATLNFGPFSDFGGDMSVSSGNLTMQTTRFRGTTNFEKTGNAGGSSPGGNVFDGHSSFVNTGGGDFYMGNGSPDSWNGDLTIKQAGDRTMFFAHNSVGSYVAGTTTISTTTGSTIANTGVRFCEVVNATMEFRGPFDAEINGTANNQLIRMGQGSGSVLNFLGNVTLKNYGTGLINNQIAIGVNGTATYNENIEVNSVNTYGIYFNTGTGTSTLAPGKTISVGGGGFNLGVLSLRNFTQLGGTPQTLLLPSTASLFMGPNSAFGGNVECSGGTLVLSSTNYAGTTKFTKSGSSNDNCVGGNIFNGNFELNHTGSGYFVFGNSGIADTWVADAAFNNRGTNSIYVAHNSTGTVFNGNVQYLNESVGNSDTGIRTCEGANSNVTFNGPVTITNNGPHNAQLIRFANGNNTNVVFNNTVDVSNNGPAGASNDIVFGGNGNVNFNNNVTVSSNSAAEIQTSTGTGTTTLAAGSTITVGGGGFNSGILRLRRFIQTGTTPQSLSLGNGASLVVGPFSDMGGNFTATTGSIFLHGAVYQGTSSFTKTNAVNDASNGNNVFHGNFQLNHNGSGYVLLANAGPDTWNGVATFNNQGSSNIYIAYNSAGNTFNGPAILNNMATSGTNVGFFVTDRPNATTTFNGPVTLNNGGAHTSLAIRFNSSNTTTTTFNNTVTLNNGGGFGANNTINMSINGLTRFNREVEMNSTTSGTIFFGSGTGVSEQASGFGIKTGVFTLGNLNVNRFQQQLPVSAANSSFDLTGSITSNLWVQNSTFTSGMNIMGPFLNEVRACNFYQPTTIIKTVSTANNSFFGGNNFFNTLAVSNQASFALSMANSAADIYYGNVQFSRLGTGALNPNVGAACEYHGNIDIVASLASLTFGGSGGTAIFAGSSPQTITKSLLTLDPVFSRVTMNKPANHLTLSFPLNVSNTLTLTSGKIISSGTSPVRMSNGSITSLGNSLSYVDGPLHYQMASASTRTLNLPVGKGADWRPAAITVTHNNGTNYTYQAEVFNASAEAMGWTKPTGIDSASHMRYWDINRVNTVTGVAAPSANLTGNQTITLYFGANDNVFDGTKIAVLKNTTAAPTTWTNIGGTGGPAGPSPTPLSGGITSTSSPNAFTSFSRFTIGFYNAIFLPVELVSFEVKKSGDKGLLHWVTANEQDASHFEVEESLDGINFQYTGTVQATGNSTSLQNYFFTDYVLNKGTNYYRIKAVDKNGSFDYTPVRTLEVGDVAASRIYPNPASGTTNLVVSNARNEELQVLVYDINGKEVIRFTDLIGVDQYTTPIAIDHLTPGQYTVWVKYGNTYTEHKLQVTE